MIKVQKKKKKTKTGYSTDAETLEELRSVHPIVDDILEIAVHLAREKNIGILLVEQDITKALAVSDYGYVIENGHVVLEQTAEELEKNEHVKKAYLGI